MRINKGLTMENINDILEDACRINDSRIIIRGGKVIIENLGPDLIDIALALNPDDPELIARAAELKQKMEQTVE